MCEVLLEPDVNWRVFQFVAKWTDEAALGYFDTRQGDCIRAAFFPEGVVIRGYNEGSPLAADQTVIDREVFGRDSKAPPILERFLKDKVFDCGGATFCIWRLVSDDRWTGVPILFASSQVSNYPLEYLELLTGDPAPFIAWVKEYHDRPYLAAPIRHLFDFQPLSSTLIGAFNTKLPQKAIVNEALKIGYPRSGLPAHRSFG